MRPALVIALAAGMLASTALFFATLGIREDIAEALQTWRFDVKLAIAAVAVAAAVFDCFRSIGPQSEKVYPLSLGALALVAASVGIELAAAPADEWQSLAVGSNGLTCLFSIPMLSLAPLVVLLCVLRSGAPASPTRAGAAVGVLSAACGAALYATHCSDDSPLFVAIWYSLAVVPVIAAGALAGSRMLKW